MSRTYHHGMKARERKFKSRWHRNYMLNEWHHPVRGSLPKRKRHAQELHWMNTPGWWIKEMMTVPWRAETRHLLHNVKKMRDLEEAPLFPNGRRPHIYYW